MRTVLRLGIWLSLTWFWVRFGTRYVRCTAATPIKRLVFFYAWQMVRYGIVLSWLFMNASSVWAIIGLIMIMILTFSMWCMA
jgi:hypothetical protein